MPRNKYPEETVQKILDASLKLFLEKGYENTTVLDIVGELGGLTRGAFYHHFKSKEAVLDALSNELFKVNNPFEKVSQEKGLNGLQKLKKLLNDSTEETEYRKLNREALPLLKNPQILAEQIESNRDIIAPAYRKLIEEGIADGSIKTGHPKQVAELFTWLTNFWLIPSVYPFDREEGMERVLLIKEVTDAIGLPVIDEQLLQKYEEELKKM